MAIDNQKSSPQEYNTPLEKPLSSSETPQVSSEMSNYFLGTFWPVDYELLCNIWIPLKVLVKLPFEAIEFVFFFLNESNKAESNKAESNTLRTKISKCVRSIIDVID